MESTWAVVRLNAIVLESALTMVEADPSELVVTPRPMSSLLVPSSAARAFEILVAVALIPAAGVAASSPYRTVPDRSGVVGFDRQNAGGRVEVGRGCDQAGCSMIGSDPHILENVRSQQEVDLVGEGIEGGADARCHRQSVEAVHQVERRLSHRSQSQGIAQE